jgi:HlyD family secretion protein
VVAALFAVMLVWALVGKLDIVASADGRLVPQTSVKIVQPADAGVVQEILVSEGERVSAGQVLMRMNRQAVTADLTSLKAEVDAKRLQLRRIDAELSGGTFTQQRDDPPALFQQVQAQFIAHRQNYLDSVEQERQALLKAEHELAASRQTLVKLQQSVPMLGAQAKSLAELSGEGYSPALQAQDKQREYQERAQDLQAQAATVSGLEAAVSQAQQHMRQLMSNYRSTLYNERVEADTQLQKLSQEFAKSDYKASLLELKAPQSGLIKDLGTHTAGSVVSPGTVLATLVPDGEPLVAEVQVKNEDVGFVRVGQQAKVKLVAFPFQKYGLAEGVITTLGPDSQEPRASNTDASTAGRNMQQQPYKATVTLQSQTLTRGGETLRLMAGMQVVAELTEGKRTVIEYLLSPLQRVVQEGARER